MREGAVHALSYKGDRPAVSPYDLMDDVVAKGFLADALHGHIEVGFADLVADDLIVTARVLRKGTCHGQLEVGLADPVIDPDAAADGVAKVLLMLFPIWVIDLWSRPTTLWMMSLPGLVRCTLGRVRCFAAF